MEMKPPIVITTLDLERLEALLDSQPAPDSPATQRLRDELGRAEIVEPEQVPPNVVTMRSKVRFVVESSGETFCKSLVYPREADGSDDRISVLAPIGTALLGLTEGQRIEWPAPGGALIPVRIVEVLYQPERSGELHR